MPDSTILLSSARSGTNFFLSVYAKCFPKDFVVKEIFRRAGDNIDALARRLEMSADQVVALKEADPLELWMQVKARCAQDDIGTVAKFFYYHAPEETRLREHFRAHDRIVHLIRRNTFDVFLSERMARETGRWQEFKKTKAPQVDPVELDVAELEAFRQRQIDYVTQAREFFSGGNYTEIFYEDIAASPALCAARIEEIYGPLQSAAPQQIGLVRQKKKTNRELVANYDAVSHLDVATF